MNLALETSGKNPGLPDPDTDSTQPTGLLQPEPLSNHNSLYGNKETLEKSREFTCKLPYRTQRQRNRYCPYYRTTLPTSWGAENVTLLVPPCVVPLIAADMNNVDLFPLPPLPVHPEQVGGNRGHGDPRGFFSLRFSI